jgi:cell division protein FtsW (lipid II flippase)
VILVMVVAIALQLAIPDKLTMKPWWLLPAVETVLLMILAVANPGGINREHRWLRTASLVWSPWPAWPTSGRRCCSWRG